MIPFSTHTIESVDNLFGRNEIISTLKFYALRCENVALIGTRRFGKTCLFKSIYNLYKNAEKAPVYPIFFDFKAVRDIIPKGTIYVYRYILAKMIAELNADGFYTAINDYPSIDFNPSPHWEQNYEALADYKIVKLHFIFNDFIITFSNIIGKTFLFLIDEYEYLFRCSFSNSEGFMPMRNLSAVNEKDKVKPFAFWIAGAMGWAKLCSIIGSGELNVINASLLLPPLNKEDFEEMWKHEVGLCDNKELQLFLLSKNDFVFAKTGGIPFYAKLLGTNMMINKKEPDYSFLITFFEQIDNSLEKDELSTLKELAVLPRNLKDSVLVKSLLEKGLIKKADDKYVVTIGYYEDYLKASTNHRHQNYVVQTACLTKEIFKLFETINHQRSLYGKDPIFDNSISDISIQDDMKRLCQNATDLRVFSIAIYLTFLEKTKADETAGKKLPTKIRYGEFGKNVDMMRHIYGGGHLEEKMHYNSGAPTRKDVLLYFLNSETEPYHADEFARFQLSVLTKYKMELQTLLEYVRKDRK